MTELMKIEKSPELFSSVGDFYPEYFILGLILLFMSPKKSRHANFELRMEELT